MQTKQLSFVHERVRKAACHAPEYIMKQLHTTKDGLADAQIDRHRTVCGSNEADTKQRGTVRCCLRRAFVNPFSVILSVLSLICFGTALVLPDGYGRNLSAAYIILAMVGISGCIRFVQELKARRISDKLTSLVHTSIAVKRSGKWQNLPSSELVAGDVVRLCSGDRVPADIRLIMAQDFFVSQSVITGESGIYEKDAAALAKEPKQMNEYTNTVFSGSVVAGGEAEGIAVAVGRDTVYGALSPSPNEYKRGFDRGSASIAFVLIKFMAVLVPIVFIVCAMTKSSWLAALLFALSVAVGLTPELLPMVVNACLARGSWQMGKKQTIVKNINAMQGFGSMDVLCIDKTGTLTSDEITLEYYTDILGNENSRVLEYAYVNSFCHTGVYNHLDSAILKCRTMPNHELYFKALEHRYKKLDERPFDYNRKFVSVLLHDRQSDERIIIIKGSVEAVAGCCCCANYDKMNIPLGADGMQNIHAVVDEMTSDGMKVLAVAYKIIKDSTSVLTGQECDFTLLGYLAFFDAPKKSAASAIRKLQSLNVAIKILSGDERNTTRSVCRRLGIDSASVLTGSQIAALSDNELMLKIENTSVFAELAPRQKAHIVQILQESGHSVGFLGDGMNDLPAQLQADVGISVDTAAEAVKESADVILLKKDLNVLEEGILEGRRAFANMAKYIKITASSNFGNICSVVIAAITLPFFPMTSLQLLLLGLLYDILCLVLPWDNVDKKMLQKPLDWSGRTLGRFMMSFGPVSSIFDILTYIFLFFVFCPLYSGGSFFALDASGQERFIALFQTGWFLESMWTQILILHLLRTDRLPFVQSRPSRSVAFITAAGLTAFTALTISPVGTLLGMTAMPLSYYAFLSSIVLLYLLTVTAAKSLYKRRYDELL